jgi:hypothetical protein
MSSHAAHTAAMDRAEARRRRNQTVFALWLVAGNCRAVARQMGISHRTVENIVGKLRNAAPGARYCCRCGQVLETEPHRTACGACDWQWNEPCPAKGGGAHPPMTRGIVCEECHKEAA